MQYYVRLARKTKTLKGGTGIVTIAAFNDHPAIFKHINFEGFAVAHGNSNLRAFMAVQTRGVLAQQ